MKTKFIWDLDWQTQKKIENLEFQITSTETNLRYLLGETPMNEEKLSKCRAQIKEAKGELLGIIKENNLPESIWAGFHLNN